MWFFILIVLQASSNCLAEMISQADKLFMVRDIELEALSVTFALYVMYIYGNMTNI